MEQSLDVSHFYSFVTKIWYGSWNLYLRDIGLKYFIYHTYLETFKQFIIEMGI